MKNYLLLILLFCSFIGFSQQNDTTKSNKNVKQIIIQLNIDLENLNNTLDDFIKKIDEKHQKIESLNDSLLAIEDSKNLNQNDKSKSDSIRLLIKINQEMVEALQKGIEDINNSIEKINIQLDSIQKDIYVEVEKDVKYKERRKKKFVGHWSAIEFGLNTFWSPHFSPNFPTEGSFLTLEQQKSWYFSANIFQISIPLYSKYFGLVSGVGFTFNNYELKNNFKLIIDSTNSLSYSDGDYNYKKNRFKTINVSVPLLLEIQIPMNKKDKRAFINFGVIGNYNLQSKMKYVYTDNNYEIKKKDKLTNFPVTDFNYDFAIRLGYGGWYINASYRYIPIFKQGFGPQINNFTTGIGLKF